MARRGRTAARVAGGAWSRVLSRWKSSTHPRPVRCSMLATSSCATAVAACPWSVRRRGSGRRRGGDRQGPWRGGARRGVGGEKSWSLLPTLRAAVLGFRTSKARPLGRVPVAELEVVRRRRALRERVDGTEGRGHAASSSAADKSVIPSLDRIAEAVEDPSGAVGTVVVRWCLPTRLLPRRLLCPTRSRYARFPSSTSATPPAWRS